MTCWLIKSVLWRLKSWGWGCSSACLACMKLWAQFPQHYTKPSMVAHTFNLNTLARQECEAILNYVSSLRSAWDTGNPVSKNKQTKPSKVGILTIVWKISTYCLNIETCYSRWQGYNVFLKTHYNRKTHVERQNRMKKAILQNWHLMELKNKRKQGKEALRALRAGGSVQGGGSSTQHWFRARC